MAKKINIIYYCALVFVLVIYLLPSELIWAVYTPNYLGWFWIAVIWPTTAITFFWSSIIDVKSKNWRALAKRVFFLAIMLLLFFAFGYLSGRLD